jgi:hypothetical protein
MTAAEKNFLCRRIVTAKFLPREVPRHRLDRRLFTGSKDLVAAIVDGGNTSRWRTVTCQKIKGFHYSGESEQCKVQCCAECACVMSVRTYRSRHPERNNGTGSVRGMLLAPCASDNSGFAGMDFGQTKLLRFSNVYRRNC